MSQIILDKYEQELLDAFENEDLLSIENLEEEKKRAQIIAQNTIKKTKNINLRITKRDLHRLKVKGIKTGIPYQTLATSVLHKFANDELNITL